MQSHAGGGEHGEASVVQLLQLHLVESLRSLGSDLQWIPSEVTRTLELVLNRGAKDLDGGNGEDDLHHLTAKLISLT